MIDVEGFEELGGDLFDYEGGEGGGKRRNSMLTETKVNYYSNTKRLRSPLARSPSILADLGLDDGLNMLDLPAHSLPGDHQFVDFQPTTQTYTMGFENPEANFLAPPQQPMKPARKSGKSKSKSKPKAKKANLMEDDGVSPNWDEVREINETNARAVSSGSVRP